MSRAIQNRLDRLEAARTDITAQMVIRRHGEEVALFSRSIRYQDSAQIHLRWPEREQVVESYTDHNAPEVEGDLVQHRYTDAAI